MPFVKLGKTKLKEDLHLLNIIFIISSLEVLQVGVFVDDALVSIHGLDWSQQLMGPQYMDLRSS